MLSRDDECRNQANDFFFQGMKLYSDNDLEQAIKLWIQAIAAINMVKGDGHARKIRENDYRTLASYHYRIGKTYIKMGDCDQAIREYTCAILVLTQVDHLSSLDISALTDCRINLAAAMYSNNQWTDGIEQYEQVIALCNKTDADEIEDESYRTLALCQQEMARGYKALCDTLAAVRCYLSAFDALSAISRKSIEDFTALDVIYAALTGIFARYDEYYQKIDNVQAMKQFIGQPGVVAIFQAQAVELRDSLQELQRQVDQLKSENAELRARLPGSDKNDNPDSLISLSGSPTLFSQSSAPRRSNRLQKKITAPSGMTNDDGLTMLCEAAESLRRNNSRARK